MGVLKRKLEDIAKTRKCYPMKKKKNEAVRCQTSRHVIDPDFKYMIEDACGDV